MSGNFLRHELHHYDEASVDIEEVLHNTHNLIRLVKPLIYVYQVLDKIRRWETWSVCIVLLAVSNITCILFEGYFTIISLLVIIGVAGLGYAHRRTNILAKFLPSLSCDCEPVRLTNDSVINNNQAKDIAQSELMEEMRMLLCFVNDVTSCVTQLISQLYLLLKWQDFYMSMKCYLCLLVFVILVDNLSFQCLLTLFLDLFLLHFPIYQYYLFMSRMRKATAVGQYKELEDKREQYDIDETLDLSVYDTMNDDQSQDTDDNKTMDGDADQKSEAGTSSEEGDLVELKVRMSSAQNASDTNSIGKSKKQGVVGKLLKTVKNQGPLGSCEGCKVNFTTILKRRRLCSHCGNHFCSRCCNYKVTRSMFGATAPAAQTETVNVCFYCFNYLNKIVHSKLNGDVRGVANEPNTDGTPSAKDKNQ